MCCHITVRITPELIETIKSPVMRDVFQSVFFENRRIEDVAKQVQAKTFTPALIIVTQFNKIYDQLVKRAQRKELSDIRRQTITERQLAAAEKRIGAAKIATRASQQVHAPSPPAPSKVPVPIVVSPKLSEPIKEKPADVPLPKIPPAVHRVLIEELGPEEARRFEELSRRLGNTFSVELIKEIESNPKIAEQLRPWVVAERERQLKAKGKQEAFEQRQQEGGLGTFGDVLNQANKGKRNGRR